MQNRNELQIFNGKGELYWNDLTDDRCDREVRMCLKVMNFGVEII